jgi:hypothetical protein
MQSCDDNIMTADAAKGIDVVIGWLLWQTLMLLSNLLTSNGQIHPTM